MKQSKPSLTDNYVLFRDIQEAFEYTRSLKQLEGDPERVTAQLNRYLAQIESVFNFPPDSLTRLDESIAEQFQLVGDAYGSDIETVQLKETRDGTIQLTDPQAIQGNTNALPAAQRKSRDFKKDFEGDHTRFRQLGIDTYATYLPIHYFSGNSQFWLTWGIYISEEGLRRLTGWLKARSEEKYGAPDSNSKKSFSDIALQVLLRHELYHYKIELFTLSAELMLGKHGGGSLYTTYLEQIYAPNFPTKNCLEEGLANAAVLASRAIDQAFGKHLYPHVPHANCRDFIEELFVLQPPAYQNYRYDTQRRYSRNGHSSLQRATNQLCNQIIQGRPDITPEEEIPFYAFPPNNFFLRAESLVPIHIIRALDADDGFIRYPTPKTLDAVPVLKILGFQLTDRGNGDHEVWQGSPGWGQVTINAAKGDRKHLDINSFRQMCRLFGIIMHEYHNQRSIADLVSLVRERKTKEAQVYVTETEVHP